MPTTMDTNLITRIAHAMTEPIFQPPTTNNHQETTMPTNRPSIVSETLSFADLTEPIAATTEPCIAIVFRGNRMLADATLPPGSWDRVQSCDFVDCGRRVRMDSRVTQLCSTVAFRNDAIEEFEVFAVCDEHDPETLELGLVDYFPIIVDARVFKPLATHDAEFDLTCRCGDDECGLDCQCFCHDGQVRLPVEATFTIANERFVIDCGPMSKTELLDIVSQAFDLMTDRVSDAVDRAVSS